MPLLLASAAETHIDERVRIVNLSSDATQMIGPRHMELQDVNMTRAKGFTETM